MLGVAIELLGTLLSVLGLNLMKYTAMRSAPEDAAQPSIVSGVRISTMFKYCHAVPKYFHTVCEYRQIVSTKLCLPKWVYHIVLQLRA